MMKEFSIGAAKFLGTAIFLGGVAYATLGGIPDKVEKNRETGTVNDKRISLVVQKHDSDYSHIMEGIARIETALTILSRRTHRRKNND